MAERFFIEDDLPPGDPNLWAEGTARSFGWTVSFAEPGEVLGLSVYGPVNSPPTPRARLFLESDQSLLAFKDYPSPLTPEVWNDILFNDPILVEPEVNYVPSFWMQGENNYAHTANFLSSDVTRGNITALASKGRFLSSPDQDAFPTSLYSGIYFVDVIFEPEGGPPPPEGGSGVGWVRKVNRHVTVLKVISATVVKLRPGIITALGAGDLINVRVGHHSETYTNLDRRTDPDENLLTSKYISY